MIENNEMSALAPSRLGMKNFINDKPISGRRMRNVEKQFEDFLQATGKKRRGIVARLKGKYEDLPQSCDKIDSSIATIMADIEAQTKKSASLKGKKLKNAQAFISIGNTAIADLKKVRAANCGEYESQKMAEEEKKFEEKLLALSESSVNKAKAEAEAGSLTSNLKKNKNILLIAGGVLALGIVGFLIFRKK